MYNCYTCIPILIGLNKIHNIILYHIWYMVHFNLLKSCFIVTSRTVASPFLNFGYETLICFVLSFSRSLTSLCKLALKCTTANMRLLGKKTMLQQPKKMNSWPICPPCSLIKPQYTLVLLENFIFRNKYM